MREIDRLRAEVRKRQQAANRKVSRIENQGISVAGTEFDPRRSDAPLHRWRMRDLQKYLGELESFTSRKTQFVSDANNRPIPRHEWNAYKRAERQANRISDKRFGQISDVYIESAGMTIAQREQWLKPDWAPGVNPAVNSPFKKINRLPEQLDSRKSLLHLTAQQQRKIKPEFMKDFVDTGRGQLDKMLSIANREDIKEAVSKLSDRQFHILWGFTGFADAVYNDYWIAKARADGESERRSDERTQRDAVADAMELVDWVQQLDDKQMRSAVAKPRKRKPKQFNDTNANPNGISIYNNTNANPGGITLDNANTNARSIPIQKPKRKN